MLSTALDVLNEGLPLWSFVQNLVVSVNISH